MIRFWSIDVARGRMLGLWSLAWPLDHKVRLTGSGLENMDLVTWKYNDQFHHNQEVLHFYSRPCRRGHATNPCPCSNIRSCVSPNVLDSLYGPIDRICRSICIRSTREPQECFLVATVKTILSRTQRQWRRFQVIRCWQIKGYLVSGMFYWFWVMTKGSSFIDTKTEQIESRVGGHE